MNKIYWVHSPEFMTTHGPFTIREAMKQKAEYDNFEEKVLILKTIIDYDGKLVK